MYSLDFSTTPVFVHALTVILWVPPVKVTDVFKLPVLDEYLATLSM